MQTISSNAKKVLISVNPKAGRTSPQLRAEELHGRLNDMGFEAEIGTNLDEIAEKANRYCGDHDLRALVGVGGDGTATELVNRTQPEVPITLLSSGTANLIAKYFRLGKNPKKLAQIIADGKTIQLDAGKANGRVFLVMASCGFDAHVVHQVHAHRENRYQSGAKRGAHISYLSYIKPIMKSIASYSYPELYVDTSNGETMTAKWAFIFNLPRYGWGIPLVINSSGRDGVLDHCLFEKGSVLNGIKYTAFAQFGAMHRHLSDVHLGKSKKYTIRSDAEVTYQLDGDPGGRLPLEIEILENRFRMIAPESVIRKYESANFGKTS